MTHLNIGETVKSLYASQHSFNLTDCGLAVVQGWLPNPPDLATQ